MNRTRATILVLTIAAGLVTTYASILALIPPVLFDLLITVEGVVLAELVLYEILRASEGTELTIMLLLPICRENRTSRVCNQHSLD